MGCLSARGARISAGRTSRPQPDESGPLPPSVVRDLARLDHLVDQAVFDSLGRREDLVTLDVLTHLILGTSSVPRNHVLQERTHPQDLARLDLDVAGLSVALASGRLVDQNSSVLE